MSPFCNPLTSETSFFRTTKAFYTCAVYISHIASIHIYEYDAYCSLIPEMMSINTLKMKLFIYIVRATSSRITFASTAHTRMHKLNCIAICNTLRLCVLVWVNTEYSKSEALTHSLSAEWFQQSIMT